MNINKLIFSLGINRELFFSIANYSSRYYKIYKLKRLNKKDRQIESPSLLLKVIQRKILYEILIKVSVHPRATGFVRKRSIKHNAKYHLGKPYVLSLDIQNFFPSIKWKSIKTIFSSIGYSGNDSFVLAKLCCFKGRLPQGAPTSPFLSNLFFKELDDLFSKHCNQQLVVYTRYADDMTFSCDSKEKLLDLIKFIEEHLNAKGFKLNYKKTRVCSGRKAMKITGLNINSGRVTVGKVYKHKLRSELHHFFVKGSDISEEVLAGKLAFLKSIEPDSYDKFMKYIQKIKTVKNS